MSATSDSSKKIPGSTSLSEMVALAINRFNFFEFLIKRHKKYGNIFKTRLVDPMIVASGKEITDALATHSDSLTTSAYASSGFGAIFPDALLNKNGPEHIHERRLVAPLFGVDSLNKIIGHSISLWENVVNGLEDNQLLDLPEFFEFNLFRINLQLISGMEFTSEELTEYIKLFKVVTHGAAVPLNLGLPFGKITKGKKCKEILLSKLLIKTKEARTKKNLSGLIGVLDQAKNMDGSIYDDTKIAETLLFLLWAILDSTASIAPWLFYHLAAMPKWQHEILEEIKAKIGSSIPSYKSLENLINSNCFIYETLRVYPPAFIILRKTLNDINIGNIFVKANSILAYSIYFTNRDPEFFYDAEAFLPERWDPSQQKTLIDFKNLATFSNGPHACLGRLMSIMQLRIILMTFLKRFQLMPDPQHPVKFVATPFITAKNSHVRLKQHTS